MQELEKLKELYSSDDKEVQELADAIYNGKVTDKDVEILKSYLRSEDKETLSIGIAIYESNPYYSINPILNFLSTRRHVRKWTDDDILDYLQYSGEFIIYEDNDNR